MFEGGEECQAEFWVEGGFAHGGWWLRCGGGWWWNKEEESEQE